MKPPSLVLLPSEATASGSWGNFHGQPQVWRGAAADWPAVRHWTFSSLRALAPDLPVQVVQGNRERDDTRLSTTTWGEHLAVLQAPSFDSPPGNLKEFDLLKEFPALLNDLRLTALFPAGAVFANQAWIGPAHARTGLHFDLLDNVALTLIGRKRFYLMPPGSVEDHQVSEKYDRWARLSRIGLQEILQEGGQAAASALRVVDLGPGDALFVPSGWWHEVVNLEPSVLLSGFFGTRRQVWAAWLKTGALHALHQAGLWRRGHCTCHPAAHESPAQIARP